jgi:regulator of RNase E activity RraA
VTVKLVAAGNEPSRRHLGTAAIAAATPNDVIVIEHKSRADAAGWGGILSTAAKTRGVRGVVVDGSCRDIDEARDVGFPLYGRAAVPTTARGRVAEQSFNEPIDVAGVTVRAGDLVIADGSGVVFVAAEQAEAVLAAAEEIAATEAAMRDAVLAGRSVVEVMGAAYESMLKRG